MHYAYAYIYISPGGYYWYFGGSNTLKRLGCVNPTLGQIWTNPNIGLKM